jgi:hypothetical protein
MKKLAILVSGTLFCLAGMAAESSDSWVKAGKETISCDKVKVGVSKARITLDNGEKKTLSTDQIDAYASNGVVFDRKMVYKNGKPTGHSQFMELMKVRDGLSLYKTMAFIDDLGEAVDQYIVYKGDNLYLALDKRTIPNVFSFFNVKWTSK